jgi:MarR family transcriptional regulator, organic hydroperoxide resistance regulator
MISKQEMVAGVVDDIRRIFQVLAEQSKRIESETGLTGSQLWVVKLLEETSPMKVSDLARRMYLNPATMVGLLDKLEAKGLVRRVRSAEDRRVVHIDLTEQGRELVNNSPEVTQSLLVKGLESITDKELQAIVDGLKSVVNILGASDAPPQLIMSPEINFSKRNKVINPSYKS